MSANHADKVITISFGNIIHTKNVEQEYFVKIKQTEVYNSTPQPLYNTIFWVQYNFRVSYPICVIMRVKYKAIYIGKLDHLGSMNGPCYIQNRAVMNRVIKRSQLNVLGYERPDLNTIGKVLEAYACAKLCFSPENFFFFIHAFCI